MNYDGNATILTARLTTVKIHINSTISTHGSRYMTLDISDFYYVTPMEPKDYEYDKIPMRILPEEIIAQ